MKIDTNLGRNSVNIERFGGRVTAPIKSTTLGCLNLNMISTCIKQPEDITVNVGQLDLPFLSIL